jgi:hypothetical protein
MAEVRIDPDRVIAMASATLTTSEHLAQDAKALQAIIDGVRDLCPGAPDVNSRCQTAAGHLAEEAGRAQLLAVQYIEREQPWRNVWTPQFWLPAWSNVWDPQLSLQENLIKALTSDEAGAGAFGLATELLNRFERGLGPLLLPKPGVELPTVLRVDQQPPPDEFIKGRGWVYRNTGFLVPQGMPGVDPMVPEVPPLPADSELRTVRPSLVESPINPLPWAEKTGKGLGVAGAALTVFGSGYSQWQQDDSLHPGMSTSQHSERAATTAVVEGGAAVAVGWGGAVVGGEMGAAIGTAICPGVGTVVGGIVGGVVGGFAGSKAGAGLGRGARKLWHSFFG